ncbi:MAG: hypothetical protein MUE96_01025 [Bacteroidia bacterium]|nr:hypothetical protein [Bacteroidia bacterium]
MFCTVGAMLLGWLGLKFTRQRLWFIINGLFLIAAGYYITAYSWYKEGNLTANINPIGFSATALTNEQQLPFQFPTNDTLYIVEVWSTSCGSCIKQMPEFAKLQLKYQHSMPVSFATLHLPVKGEQLSQALGILNRVGCQLPSYFATSTSSWQQLNIDAVPVVLMIRNQQIVKAFASTLVPVLSFPLRPSIESEMLEQLASNE